jgi:hypothetical protein
MASAPCFTALWVQPLPVFSKVDAVSLDFSELQIGGKCSSKQAGNSIFGDRFV